MVKEESRLDAYRRLADVTSSADVADIRAEWLDLYGPLPEPALALIGVGQLRAECHRVGLTELVVADGRARMTPVVLKASQTMRLKRIAQHPDWNEKLGLLTITLPRTSTGKLIEHEVVPYLIDFLQQLFEPAN